MLDPSTDTEIPSLAARARSTDAIEPGSISSEPAPFTLSAILSRVSRGAVQTDHAIVHEALRFLAMGDEPASAALVDRIESAAGRRLLERSSVHQGMVTALSAMFESYGFEASPSLRKRADKAQITRLSSESILARVDATLTARRIPWVALKGSVVAYRYARPELRSFNDVDVLVPARRFGEALSALSDAGFRDLNRNWGNYLRFGIAETPLLASGASIDLHWHVIGHGSQRRRTTIDIDEMLHRRRQVRLGQIEVPAFDAEDLLLHVAVHAAISGGTRLSWLWDVRELVRAERLDWGVFIRRLIATGVAAQVGQLLDRARLVLDADVPTAVIDETCPRSLLVIRRYVDERDDAGGLPRRFLRGFPVQSSRSTLTGSVGAAASGLARRARSEPGWDVGDPDGALFWQRESGGPDSREAYLAWASQTGAR